MPGLPKICWVVVDGLPHWLVTREVLRDPARYPMVSRIVQAGQMAELQPVSPNCQTPPSLCSLFSGTGADRHGLTGFDIPDSRDPLAKRNAFQAFAHDVPMIWDRYAAAGQRVALCHIPYVSRERLGAALVSQTYGFVPPAIAPVTFVLKDDRECHVVPGTDLAIATHRQSDGHVSIRVTPSVSDRPSIHLKPGEWQSLSLCAGAPTLACLCTVAGTSRLHILGSYAFSPAGQAPDRIGTRHPFVAGGLTQIFRTGGFGRSLIDGGAGQAEEVFFQGVRALSKRYWAEAILAAAADTADLTLCYQPAYDLLFHEILGLVDPDNGHATPARTQVAERLLSAALADIDCGLAALVRAARGRPVVMCSDHGMKPVDTILCPNVLLQDWGYLQTDAGQIDAGASQAFFHPAETGAVWFAKTLPFSAQKAILDRLAGTFSKRTGRVSHWFAAQLPTGGPDDFTRHLFFAPGKGQTLKAHVDGPATRPSRKTADHATYSDEESLLGVVASVTHPIVLPNRIATQDVAQTFVQGFGAEAANVTS